MDHESETSIFFLSFNLQIVIPNGMHQTRYTVAIEMCEIKLVKTNIIISLDNVIADMFGIDSGLEIKHDFVAVPCNFKKSILVGSTMNGYYFKQILF